MPYRVHEVRVLPVLDVVTGGHDDNHWQRHGNVALGCVRGACGQAVGGYSHVRRRDASNGAVATAWVRVTCSAEKVRQSQPRAYQPTAKLYAKPLFVLRVGEASDGLLLVGVLVKRRRVGARPRVGVQAGGATTRRLLALLHRLASRLQAPVQHAATTQPTASSQPVAFTPLTALPTRHLCVPRTASCRATAASAEPAAQACQCSPRS